MYYVLGANIVGPGFPTLWSGPPSYVRSIINTQAITPHFGMSTGQTAYDAAQICIVGVIIVFVVFIDVWSRRFVMKSMSRQIQDAEHDVEIWSRRFEQKNTSKHIQETEDDHERWLVLFKYGGGAEDWEHI